MYPRPSWNVSQSDVRVPRNHLIRLRDCRGGQFKDCIELFHVLRVHHEVVDLVGGTDQFLSHGVDRGVVIDLCRQVATRC